MKSLRSKTRRIRRWIESLDCPDDGYFGYGDDWAVFIRKVARPIKQFVVRVSGQATVTNKQMAVKSSKRISINSPQPANDESLQNCKLDSPAQPVVYHYLPFSLPDEIRVREFPLPAPQSTGAQELLGSAALPAQGTVNAQPEDRGIVGPWTGRVAGLAAGIAALQLFVIRPLFNQISMPARQLSDQTVPLINRQSQVNPFSQSTPAQQTTSSKPIVASADLMSDRSSDNSSHQHTGSASDRYQR